MPDKSHAEIEREIREWAEGWARHHNSINKDIPFEKCFSMECRFSRAILKVLDNVPWKDKHDMFAYLRERVIETIYSVVCGK